MLAAVYDVRTGQSWRLGDGPAQDEASVVKVDILETLLNESDGAGLPADDQALALQFDLADCADARRRPAGLGYGGEVPFGALQAEKVLHQAALQTQQTSGPFAERGACPAAHPEHVAVELTIS